ncbi:MAG: radical SAM protein [Armatimonadetes bacterium]|nr:radical SAM protein [Armatimonadota bacterium]
MQDTVRLIFWELTARCNLKCQHCRAEAQDDFVAGELTTDEILQVAKDIREAGDPIVILTGGEPLVRPDFFEIAEGCTKLFTRVALATNGTNIDDAKARRIADVGIQRVSISLDGALPATHDEFRGIKGSFAAALKGFDAMKNAGLSLQVNVTVTQHNDAEIEDLLNLCLERGADAFHVFMLVPVGCGAQISDDVRLSPKRFEERLIWLFEKSIELQGRIHIKATCAPQYFRIMREISRKKGIPLPESGHGMHATTRGCLAGSAVCFVSRVGDVQPCGYLPIQIGNVRERKFGDIWRDSQVFAELRDPNRLKGKCGACEYRKVCLGCRARAYAESGDYLTQEPDCPYIPAKSLS